MTPTSANIWPTQIPEKSVAVFARRRFAIMASAFMATRANAREERPLVLTVGHAGSAASSAWYDRQGAAWMRNQQFRRVRYEKIDIPDGGHLMDPAVWPANRRWIVETLHRDDSTVLPVDRKEWERRCRRAFGDDVDGPLHFYVASGDQSAFDVTFVTGGWEYARRDITKRVGP
jgi:hypothetical protein